MLVVTNCVNDLGGYTSLFKKYSPFLSNHDYSTFQHCCKLWTTDDFQLDVLYKKIIFVIELQSGFVKQTALKIERVFNNI